MQVCFIHGFNSTHRSFNYLSGRLPPHETVVINYDSHQGIETSIASVKRQLPKKPFVIVGHSLGGVLGALLADALGEQVSHLVTISSPVGGSKAASALRWLPHYPRIMGDITPHSARISQLSEMKLRTPTLSIISTGGSLPTSSEANDSIVTVASQKALCFGRKVEIKANHFEVLQHEKTVQQVRDFLFDGEAL
jgi:pimeloyl-ACP methyl ester carboxylesterase